MANRILSKDEIVAELTRLDDVTGAAAGYYVGDTKIIRKIDSKHVGYSTVDLLMSLNDFSQRVLLPLIRYPRKSDEIIGPTEIDDPEYPSNRALWQNTNKDAPGHIVYNIVEDITKKRGSVYGPFLHNSIVAQAIKAAVRNIPDPDNEGLRWENLPLDVRESLDLIALKMSRIVTGDCEYLDNWDDIGGYAKIVADRIRAKDQEHVA